MNDGIICSCLYFKVFLLSLNDLVSSRFVHEGLDNQHLHCIADSRSRSLTCHCVESGAKWSGSVCNVGNALHPAEPDDILTASDGNVAVQLLVAVTAAASDGAVNLVRLTPCCVLSWVFYSAAERRYKSKATHIFVSLSLTAPRFLLENFCLHEHVRYIVTIYPVVIVWLTGTLDNADSLKSPIFIFTGTVWLLDWGKLAHSILFNLPLRDYFNFWLHNLFFSLQLWSWLFPAFCSWHVLPWSPGNTTNNHFTVTVNPISCHQQKFPQHKAMLFFKY